MKRLLLGLALAFSLALQVKIARGADGATDPTSDTAGLASGLMAEAQDGAAQALAAPALPPGVWTKVGDMLTSRTNFTATLLDNGKILLAGGSKSMNMYLDNATRYCELFDPATGMSVAAAPMNAARFNHAALKLADGRVLVVGGSGPAGGSQTSCEIYDPVANKWTNTGSLKTGTSLCQLVALNTGKILKVCGGNGSPAYRACELYDPATGLWTVTGSTATGHYLGLSCYKLTDGKVALVAGYSMTIEIYNPATGTWSTAPGRTSYYMAYSASFMGTDGKIGVVGGSYYSPALSLFTKTVDLFNPTDGTVKAGAPLVIARERFRIVPLGGGNMLAIGGSNGSYNYLAYCEYYNQAEGLWRPCSPLNSPRAQCEAILTQGTVYVFGGSYNSSDGQTPTVLTSIEALIPQAPQPITNSKPVAGVDNATISEDLPNPFNVLTNDYDLDNDPLRVVEVMPGANGTTSILPDGQVLYLPNANFNGKDSFVYAISDDDNNTTLGTVNVTVTPVNDAPVAVNDSYTVDEDTALDVPAPGVMSNDYDVDGDALTAILKQGPAHGTLTFNSDGSFRYVPETNYNYMTETSYSAGETSYGKPDTFTYVVRDGSTTSSLATVSITVNPVNDPPVASSFSVFMSEDYSVGISLRATDVDKDALSYSIVTPPAHGWLSGTGSYRTYRPETNYNGTDSFTFKANDGKLDSNPATVAITIYPVNDPPVAVNDRYTIDEDTVLDVRAPGVMANDYDIEGNPFTAQLLTTPAHGKLSFNADGSFRYTPETNYCATETNYLGVETSYDFSDHFTYRVAETGYSGLVSNPATVFITIRPVNDPPVAGDDAYSLDEDTPLTVPASAGLLVNDSDVEHDPLHAVLLQAPDHGQLELNADGSFTYLPETNFNGMDGFVYRACDDKGGESQPASVYLNINPVNDAPVLTAVTIPGAPNLINTPVAASASFTDPDAGDTHTATWEWGDGTTSAGTVDEATGKITGEHSYSAPGLYTVKLTVTDQAGASDSKIATTLPEVTTQASVAGAPGSQSEAFAVIYDPQAGFITGGGWIDSPAGAYASDPGATGEATYAFEVKYKDASTLNGMFQLQLKGTDLDFRSATFQWLVVNGAKAFVCGEGSINGKSGYGFMATIVDGKIGVPKGEDRIRIRIWDLASGQTLYDNQAGASKTADPTMAVVGGNFVVHLK